MPRLSFGIVTPSYNQARFLPDTLDSVVQQRGDFAIDYVVMDGGSTDGSVDILEAYARKLELGEIRPGCKALRFRWFSLPDAGQYDAVNRGFDRLEGDILAYLNSDDVYLPNALGVVHAVFSSFDDVRWVTSGMPAQINEDREIIGVDFRDGFCRDWFLGGQHLPGTTGFFRWVIQQDCTFWRRELWNRVGPFDARYRYAGDFEMWLRMFRHAELYTLRTLVGAFRVHAAQKTSQLELYCEEARQILLGGGGRVPGRLSRSLRGAVHWKLQRVERFRRLATALLGGHLIPFVEFDWASGTWRAERRRYV